jgi:hypothetical protein
MRICALTVPNMGLCNRIKCMISIIRYCQLSGNDFGLC